MLKSNVLIAALAGLVLGGLAELFFVFFDRVPVLGCLFTPVALLFGLVLPVLIGAMAAAWIKPNGLLTTPSSVLDGASAAALAELATRIIGVCASLAAARTLFLGPRVLLPGVGPATRGLFTGVWALGWLVVSLAFAAALGALGGFLYRTSRRM